MINCVLKVVPSAPKVQQNRPQAVTSPHQMVPMQTMIPRPMISAPQGFRKPMQMTQATVNLIKFINPSP